jgi:hypothetical protein
LQNSAVFCVKNAKLLPIFLGENIFKIITSVPGDYYVCNGKITKIDTAYLHTECAYLFISSCAYVCMYLLTKKRSFNCTCLSSFDILFLAPGS